MLKLNSIYGQRRLLLDYAGVSDRPVHAFLQHGWSLTADAGSGRWANSQMFKSAPRLFWSVRQADEACRAGVPNAVVAGAPFIYLMTMMQEARRQGRAAPAGSPLRDILVYPPHNTLFIQKFDPLAALGDSADAVKSGARVTVCLHPEDAKNPRITSAYWETGARVVTQGKNSFDPNFLFKQFTMLEAHDEVWAYGCGSAALYASAMGNRVLFRDNQVAEQSKPAAVSFDDRRDIHQCLSEATTFKDFAADELGLHQRLGRVELGRLLGFRGIRGLEARSLRVLGRVQARVRHLMGDATAAG